MSTPKPHSWVAMQYKPVEVDREEDGSLTVTESADGQELAQNQALLGCWFCHAPLDLASFDTLCYPDGATSEIKGE